MAIQFIPRQDNSGIWSGLGQLLGELGGLGIGYGLQQHSQSKQEKAFRGMGMSHPEAKMLAQLPPALQSQFLKEKMREQEANRQSMLLGQAVSGISPLDQAMGSLGGQIPGVMNEPAMQAQAPAQVVGMTPMGPQGEIPFDERMRRIIQSGLNPQQLQLATNILGKAEKARTEERKFAFEQEKERKKEQSLIDKETRPFYDKTRKDSKAAKENNMRLGKMETLIDRGRLTGPGTAAFLDTISKGIFGFGLDLHSFTDPDTQEFRKLSNDFVKNAKEIFGARLTDADLKVFLATVPTLTQSDDAKRRVINNLKIFNEAANADAIAMEEIIEANGGYRPRNLEALTEKRAEQIRNKLAAEFKSGMRDFLATPIGEVMKFGPSGKTQKGEERLPLTDIEAEFA